MDFAPYQDDPPATERELSPPRAGVRSPTPSPGVRSPQPSNNRPNASSRNISGIRGLPPPDAFTEPAYQRPMSTQEQRGQSLEAFQTSLHLRLDYEAMLAYLLLPPAGSVLLLIMEHKSDYVRFHAFQGSMLFSIMFILHLVFSWNRVLSWLLLAIDLVFMLFLAGRAYRDVDTLEQYEVPVLGRLASRWVDDE